MLTTIFLMIVALCSVDAFGSRKFTGAVRNQACNSLVPGHGATRQAVSSSFRLQANKDQATGVVSVTLTGDRPFKGFVIQAQGVDGTFDEGRNHMDADCDQPTIRHRNPFDKSSITGVWTCAQPCQSGNLVFKGTVVESYFDYYELNLVSIAV